MVIQGKLTNSSLPNLLFMFIKGTKAIHVCQKQAFPDVQLAWFLDSFPVHLGS